MFNVAMLTVLITIAVDNAFFSVSGKDTNKGSVLGQRKAAKAVQALDVERNPSFPVASSCLTFSLCEMGAIPCFITIMKL